MDKKFIVFISLIMLTACQVPFFGQQNPPLPTIVPAHFTATSQPTITPKPAEPTLTPTLASTKDTLVSTATATVTSTPSPPPTPTIVAFNSLSLSLLPVADDFERPVYLTHANDNSARLFVIEQPGRIRIIKNGDILATPFLDITTIVGSEANEQGLLSVAFHPDYATNGLFFINYTNTNGDTIVARYQVSNNPDTADADSAKILLTIAQPYGNHNGGQLAFGPDGYLYAGTGDGGAANDPHDNGQNLDTLLGKILRLDVNSGEPYGVSADNPFVNQPNARPEIWSYGWRNPWRFSFDTATGDMYIADVGQNKYEEVHVELAGTPGGQNYGWRLMEGAHCFNPAECNPASLNVNLPVAEYEHSEGCSITGGYVYRGAAHPDLTGTYLYGDYCSGQIWGLRREADGRWSNAPLLSTDTKISSFGQDPMGEIYLVNHYGDIFKITH